jgi:hypothetical protein
LKTDPDSDFVYFRSAITEVITAPRASLIDIGQVDVNDTVIMEILLIVAIDHARGAGHEGQSGMSKGNDDLQFPISRSTR